MNSEKIVEYLRLRMKEWQELRESINYYGGPSSLTELVLVNSHIKELSATIAFIENGA